MLLKYTTLLYSVANFIHKKDGWREREQENTQIASRRNVKISLKAIFT